MTSAVALTLLDETPAGTVLHRVQLTLASSSVTARELIEQRVRSEAARHAAAGSTLFQGLVQPAASAAETGGYRLGPGQQVDADAQCARALAAFEGNRFLLFADDRQVESLEERIVIRPATRVAFVKLTPLVGG